ncbi:hypothetical protein GC081_11765, partial [Neisseria meningitidis]|nr:hypothetical protein [Neisseria meningitidis]
KIRLSKQSLKGRTMNKPFITQAQLALYKYQPSRKKQKPSPPSFPRRRESKNATQQEFIRKNRNPTDRHSRKSGNPATQRSRNLSEKTETPTDRHSRKSGNPATEKPQESISKNRNPHRRHSRKSGNPDPSARKLTE